MESPRCVDAAKAGCGEGLLWDAGRGRVWWVDISGEALHGFDPATGASTRQPLPCLIAALALRDDGALLIATARGLGLVAPGTGEIETLHDPEPESPGNRLNDMIAGPDGALWVGTMSEGAQGPTGALYRYDGDGPQVQMRGTTISNGLGWSPDGARLYFIDSVPGVLHVREEGRWRALRRFDETTGKPDGLTVDAEGTLWVAICDRGRVLGLRPDGEIVAQIDLPCEIVTNCCFGGADLRTLYITTGTFSMSEAEKAANPLAGGLFAVDMAVPGMLPHAARWP
ncbi:SMP-30/gluconolactonase/LRE family protein [Marinovum sp.]|uniref:SMP-30/gluconolactonase/LRE family protein n=1 Tax=Marinovum sp. TaxID=2024839 RepID=UPI002B278D95|nr:SMP-30/gluconolactonase/LRE family protein [Marinovum sp.]